MIFGCGPAESESAILRVPGTFLGDTRKRLLFKASTADAPSKDLNVDLMNLTHVLEQFIFYFRHLATREFTGFTFRDVLFSKDTEVSSTFVISEKWSQFDHACNYLKIKGF